MNATAILVAHVDRSNPVEAALEREYLRQFPAAAYTGDRSEFKEQVPEKVQIRREHAEVREEQGQGFCQCGLCRSPQAAHKE